MLDRFDIHEFDVIVIGAGGAGLRAAIEASAQGTRVGLLCKSLLGKAHTVMAEGGIAAALGNVDPDDGWKTHFKDTMKGGRYLNNNRMAELHAKESPDRVLELEQWGAVFDRTPDGRIMQRPFGGHTYRRLAHVGDRTGLELIRTLQDKGVHSGIDVFMEFTVTKLLKDGDCIAGAFGYWRETGKFAIFRAKSIVIATGGLGKVYRITSNSWEGTGDGQALAYEAGAELIDMEFIQFHPTGMVWPPGVAGILVTEAVRGEGGHLKNNKGERFMYDNIPALYKSDTAETPEEAERWLKKDAGARRPAELLPRDMVARAIYEEVKAGRGSPHGGVFLDISHRPADYVKKKLPSMYHQFKDFANIDITKEPMEVGPTAHYTMGGIRVNADTQESTVKGLYAAGEAAGGLHGANRLGGNSLSDLVVFGKLAGEHAAKYAKSLGKMPALNEDEIMAAEREVLDPFERIENAENPYTVHRDLQTMMHNLVGIFRTQSDLEKAIEELKILKERVSKVGVFEGSRMFNPGWHLTKDLQNMMIIAEAITLSAEMRKESRGAHSRLDYTESNDDLSKLNTCIKRGAKGEMQVSQTPVPSLPDELKALL